jgi:hypothetical protein
MRKIWSLDHFKVYLYWRYTVFLRWTRIWIAMELSSRFQLETLQGCAAYHFFASSSAVVFQEIVSTTLTTLRWSIKFEMARRRTSTASAAALLFGPLVLQLGRYSMSSRLDIQTKQWKALQNAYNLNPRKWHDSALFGRPLKCWLRHFWRAGDLRFWRSLRISYSWRFVWRSSLDRSFSEWSGRQDAFLSLHSAGLNGKCADFFNAKENKLHN